MNYNLRIPSDEYTGFLSFLSEELLAKGKISRFYIFRYRTSEEDDSFEYIMLDIKDPDEEFGVHFRLRLQEMQRSGMLQMLDTRFWNWDRYVFGEKGSEMAKDILALSTEIAIKTRERFGKLLDPQNEFPDETMSRMVAPGAWLLLSSFFNAAGYSTLQEINSYITAIQNRLRLMGPTESERIRGMLHLALDII